MVIAEHIFSKSMIDTDIIKPGVQFPLSCWYPRIKWALFSRTFFTKARKDAKLPQNFMSWSVSKLKSNLPMPSAPFFQRYLKTSERMRRKFCILHSGTNSSFITKSGIAIISPWSLGLLSSIIVSLAAFSIKWIKEKFENFYMPLWVVEHLIEETI